MAKFDKWEYAVIDAYKPLESIKGWKMCRKCREFPRVWEFNNGRFAKCLCGDKYSGAEVRTESILSVHKRNGGNLSEYKSTDLRDAWNKYIETGIVEKLPEGYW